ncbi:MAG: polysaccharide deacetylase family protein [Ignavibacteriota bacterium]|nr:polysaccharide deacetylase family protein [Ignavibacteriales bacterium]QKJ98199.1 MAG: polysaccharide deacetylase family protein [Ignavibacteriota bacterium]HOJ06653.1 polysaccharide deacetylase family protein [Ignavibacteriaceae bacterium]
MKQKIIFVMLLLSFNYSNAQYGPVVSFTYDDGFGDWYDIGFPIFKEYGFPAVLYINGTNPWVSGNVDKLLEMQAAGWEISNHTYNHTSGITESNVSLMKTWLDANGFPNSGFAAPNNDWNHSLVNIVKKYSSYYSTATELPGISEPFDLYFTQRINLTNRDNIATMRAYLDDAVANKKWIVFLAHEFGGTYGDGSTWFQSDSLLRLVLDAIVERGIPVKTVREVINDQFPPGCVIECSRDTMQSPVLTSLEQQGTGEPLPLNSAVWNEYWHNTSWTGPRYLGSPVVYCHTSNDSLPVMKFFRNIPNGEYEVKASIIERDPGRTYKVYYSFDSTNVSQYNVEVTKNSEVSLGTVTVTNGKFALYTQKADAISGGDGYVGWAFIKLIAKPLLLSLKVFLEGSYNGSVAMTTTLKTQGLLPKYQPYKFTPWNYLGTEATASFPANAVDWVMIELRSDLNNIVSRRAGFLLSDGSVVDIDGSSPLAFKGLNPGNYYVVVRHRNHLAIMSASAISLSSSPTFYDFTTAQTQAYGTNPMKDLGGGIYGMIGGDMDGDGNVDYSNDLLTKWLPSFGFHGYFSTDTNLNSDVDYSEDVLIDWLPNFGFSTQVP